ncbi:MAG TPA: CDP-alcohol phosphatidyltransferase family protein [Candidatus Thermoplasmatota archaeon]|nr:CDP-alcohol phosphatidyltransferase family protein [Candidatus Thermoplasmatota archaeon]
MAAPENRYARLRRVPDLLTLSRFPLAAGMILATLAGDKPIYLVLILLTVLTDIFDGAIARVSGAESRYGANLDSLSDLTFYLAVAVCTFVWAPDVLLPYAPVVGAFTAAYLISLVVAKRYRGTVGFHNRFGRTAATLGILFAVYASLWGQSWILAGALIAVATIDLAQRFWRVGREAAARKRPPARLAHVHGMALPRNGNRADEPEQP